MKQQGWCFLLLVTAGLFILFQPFTTFVRGGEITAVIGKKVKLTCTSNYLLWWTFNGRNITEKEERYNIIPGSIDFVENVVTEINDPKKYTSHLEINNVKVEDEGNFTCHNSKTIENEDREKIFILKPVMEAKIVNTSSEKIKIKISQSTTLYCLLEAYPFDVYKSRIHWLKYDNPQIDLKNQTKVIPVNNTFINSTLEINNAFMKDNGSYACSVFLVSSDEVLTKQIIVLVLNKPKIKFDRVQPVGATKIFVNWTVDTGNDPIQIYYMQLRINGSKDFNYYNNPIDIRNTSFVLNNLLPNTSYQLKITARNVIGDGMDIHHQLITTLEKDPIFVPKIEVKGSSASTITIGWLPPPPDLLQFIQYYELVAFKVGDPTHIIEAIHQQNNRNLPYMFDKLNTSTEYNFKVRACSELTKLCGNWSESVNGTTMDGISSEPLNVKIVCRHFNISRRNTVTVTWDPPKYPNGKITSYQVILDGIATYRVNNGVIKNETWGPKIKSVDEKLHKAEYEGVFPNTNYTVRVSGVTRSKKPGLNAVASCSMPIAVPDNIGKLVWGKIKTNDDNFVFKLYLPRISERNGSICCYKIYLVRVSEFNQILPSPWDIEILSYHKVHSANNTKGGAYLAEMFPTEKFNSEILLGDGHRLNENQIDTDDICKKCYLKVQLKHQRKKLAKQDKINNTVNQEEASPIIPELTQREQLNKASNLTKAASKILDSRKRKRDLSQSNINVQNSIKTNSSVVYPEIYDGEIDPLSNYTGFIVLIVENNNYGSEGNILVYSDYFEMLSTAAVAENLDDVDNVFTVLHIVLQVLCTLIVLFLLSITALCVMDKFLSKNTGQGDEVISLRDSLSRALCGGRTGNHRHLIGSALAKPTDIGPISKNDLQQAYISRHKDTDYGFLREYEMLPNRFTDRTTKNSDAKENAHKNRYPDIKAYDQTRVKLSMMNSIQGSDYINANFVIGYKERKKFICAQGPMDNTIIDFWRMIWEQHLEIIVMLTNLEEYNKAKCAKYWPEQILDSKQFGDITVIFASEHRYSDFLVRNLDIIKRSSDNEEERRKITQFHYLVWKDFSAPEHPHGIIKFIRQINSVYSVQRGPILVHCSAGVGRTGTLVALDSLMQQLEEEGQVSIFNTVCDLRHQRNFLVQSLKQYIFLYRALLDIAQFGNTELPAKGLSTIVENLKQKANDSRDKCKLEMEFDKIKSIIDETSKSCAVGSGDENMGKNRSEYVIPFDRNRVILTPIATREHSTYINASFIEGYDNSESFIITQDPMENTIGDFWRMISEQGITTLIMLSEIGDGPRKCPRYWADDEAQYDHVLVRYMQSESCPYYTRREFQVTNCKIDDTIIVTQLQYNGWPTVEGEVPEVCRGIIELVDQAQKHHSVENDFSTLSPIAVHCSLGTDRSSIFVAVCILVQQLRTEKKIDVYTTTRKLRSQRNLLLDTYAQYEFLHRAMVNYADLHKLSLDSLPEC